MSNSLWTLPGVNFTNLVGSEDILGDINVAILVYSGLKKLKPNAPLLNLLGKKFFMLVAYRINC
jgi:hypothetical protein